MPMEYGVRWSPVTPRWAVKRLLGYIHVSTPFVDIVRDLHKRMAANNGYTDKIKRETIRYALFVWQDNLNLYNRVTHGV